MSSEWIEQRINDPKSGLTPAQTQSILAGLKDGKTQRVYAQSDDASGTKFFSIGDKLDSNNKRIEGEAMIVGPWNQ